VAEHQPKVKGCCYFIRYVWGIFWR